MGIFNSTPSSKLPRALFDLSCDRKTSINFGYLYPVFLQEAVPGDRFRGRHQCQVRFAPMVSPAYAQFNVNFETYFTPKRLLMKGYEEFRTRGPMGTSAPVVPYFDPELLRAQAMYMRPGTLWDHMGLPCAPTSDDQPVAPKVSALPFRAYALIYNEWYRVPEINSPIAMTTDDGVVSQAEQNELLGGDGTGSVPVSASGLRRRNWARDYFTTLWFTAQRGAAASAPIDVSYLNRTEVYRASGAPAANAYVASQGGIAHVDSDDVRFQNISTASVLYEAIRLAGVVQRFSEKMLRGGSRYTEFLWQIFKTHAQDSRLQRPELLSRSSGRVAISEVLSTVQFEGSGTDLPQANMAGHGQSVGTTREFNYTAPEDGYFITIMSVTPKGKDYGNGLKSGIHRMWQRFTWADEYLPDFANLGEQAVLNQELAYDMSQPNGNTYGQRTLGYAPRYSEYKEAYGSVHGDFRTSLEYWHENRGFTVDNFSPALNRELLEIDDQRNRLNRIFAVEGGDHLWCHIHHDIKAFRPMPYHSIPGYA